MSATARPESGKIREIHSATPGEPKPIWRKAPRHVPQVEFPAYRHVPGVTPHPERDKKGHSYGLKLDKYAAITQQNWQKNREYLRGFDLYHAGYFWEAHEAWEGVWRAAKPDSLEANLLQALILNSAAQLKIHLGNAAGARAHSQAARWRLARIRSKGYGEAESRFLGIDVGDFVEQIKRHYGPLWESESNDTIRVRGRAPRIALEGLDD